ncbi:MAG: hypothetical protein ACYTBJ_22585, partial [Planctomycetota bacterium]
MKEHNGDNVFEKNIERLIKASVSAADAHASFHQNLIDAVRAEVQKRPLADGPNGTPFQGRTIMKSTIIKLAAAAVVVMALLIAIARWRLSETEQAQTQQRSVVQVPAELAAKPINELLQMHFAGDLDTEYDLDVIAAAVDQALGKLAAADILALAAKYTGRRAERALRAAYHPKPVTDVVEAAQIVVRGRVSRVDLDVNDLKAAIIEKNRKWIEDFAAWIRARVKLEVLETYPEVGLATGHTLFLRPVFSTRRLDLLEQGKEYLIALNQRPDVIWMLSYGEGVYPIEPNSEMVSGFRAGEMPLDEAWEFIM